MALAGSNLKDVLKAAPGEAGAAVTMWLVGLLVASLAGVIAYTAQKKFLAAARAGRKAASARLIGARDPRLVEIMAGDSLAALERTHACRQCAAEIIWKLAITTSFLSLILFVVGVVFAARAVWAVGGYQPT